MKYFSYISNEYQTKNKLQAEVLAGLRQLDRIVIDEEDLLTFKEWVAAVFRNANEHYPKCNEVSYGWQRSRSGSKDWYLDIGPHQVCIFYLLASK